MDTQRAAIYARYSSSNQNESSLEDQIRDCQRFAATKGWSVVQTATDAEASGASRLTRPGLQQLLATIDAWDVLLVFDATRLARNVEDSAHILSRLAFRGRRAISVSTGGDLGALEGKILSVIAEHDLEKISVNTHRALRGRIERGHAAGAPPYGYTTTADGEEKKLIILPERAKVVERIFALYASGVGVKSIAHSLNAHGIPAARKGSTWAPTAIREMIRNETYIGRLLWGRSEWRKDPNTGKRVRLETPSHRWVEHRDEGLRIVSPEVWEAVQSRITARQGTMRRSGGRKIPKGETSQHKSHLLSGLLECVECGGAFADLRSRSYFGCVTRKERGSSTCGNDLHAPIEAVETRVLTAIQGRVLEPESIEIITQAAIAEVAERLRAPTDAERARLAEVNVTIPRLVDAIVTAGDVPELAGRLRTLQTERERLQARIAAAEGAAITAEAIRANVLAGLHNLVDVLRTADREEARRVVADLLDGARLRVAPDPGAEGGYAIRGALRPLRLVGGGGGAGMREGSGGGI